jgi:hypothetical protein
MIVRISKTTDFPAGFTHRNIPIMLLPAGADQTSCVNSFPPRGFGRVADQSPAMNAASAITAATPTGAGAGVAAGAGDVTGAEAGGCDRRTDATSTAESMIDSLRVGHAPPARGAISMLSESLPNGASHARPLPRATQPCFDPTRASSSRCRSSSAITSSRLFSRMYPSRVIRSICSMVGA